MAHSTELMASNSVVEVSDVDWPLMGVQAPEDFDGGVDYGIQTKVATAVEVDGAEAKEEGEI